MNRDAINLAIALYGNPYMYNIGNKSLITEDDSFRLSLNADA